MRPFELGPVQLREKLDDMVEATFLDIQSEFLILPKGAHSASRRDAERASAKR